MGSRLQTDHKASYIIQDNEFRWLQPLGTLGAPGAGGDGVEREVALSEAAKLHLALPCGAIRGALQAIGVECQVTAQAPASALPACTFTVTLRSNAGTGPASESVPPP